MLYREQRGGTARQIRLRESRTCSRCQVNEVYPRLLPDSLVTPRTIVTTFELSAPRDAALIANVRRFVGELCQHLLEDSDIASRVVLATHEMLDNAVRHAAADRRSTPSQLKVTLKREDREASVVIDTTNAVDEARAATLRRVLDEIAQSTDRAEFYVALIRRIAARAEATWLGLGRVHAESELGLSGRFEEGLVHLRAEGRFPLDAGRRG